MSTDLSTASAVSYAFPPIDAILEADELRFQQLLQLIGWSYCAIWLQTTDGRLSWCYGHINSDKADNPLMFPGLEQYSRCTLSLRMGFEGKAILSGRQQWFSGTTLLQSADPKQARFFRDACIQTVVCIPYLSGVLELGTTDAVQEDEELVWNIRRFLSPAAGPPLVDAPVISAPASQGECGEIFLRQIGSEEVQYRSDTGSSNSNSSHSELSRQTSANNVLSPGLSPPTLADYAFDIFEQLNMDRHTVTRTVTNLPTADIALKFCTTLPSSLVDAPSTVSHTQQHNPTSVASRASQEFSNIHIDDHTMTPMDLEFGTSTGPFRTELQLLPGNAEIAREIHGFSSSHTILDSTTAAPNPAYVQDPLNNFDSRSIRSCYGDTSNTISAFKKWTAQAPSSQSGKENIIVADSLWRRWLRYVVPQMKSGRPTQAVPQIGTQHTMLAARQHMMAERTRRGKQNECFRALRSLAPNLRKKDKVTVLQHTIQSLQRLSKQVEELQEQNLQYASASHQSPETGEGVRSAALRKNTAQIAAPSRSVSSELQRIEVTYDAANMPPRFQIEIEATGNAEARDTLINVLTALKQVKLASVQVDARYERNNFIAKLSALHEDDGKTILHPDELRALLRSVV